MSPILKIKNIAGFAAVKAAEINAELFSGHILRDELRKMSQEYEINKAALSSVHFDSIHNCNKEIESSLLARSAFEKELSLAGAAAAAKPFDLLDNIGSASKSTAEYVRAAEKSLSKHIAGENIGRLSIYESSLLARSAIEKELDSAVTAKSSGLLDSIVSAANKARDEYDAVRAAGKFDSLFSHNYLDQLLEEVSGNSTLVKTISSLASPAIIKEVILPHATDAAMFNYKFKTLYEYSEFEEKFEEANTKLANAQDESDFIEIFKKLPIAIKNIFFFILIQIVCMPFAITSNIITPRVESYIFNSNASKTQKINHIKNIPMTIKNIDTTNLRFISGENVYLRRSPAVASNVLDLTKFGQVVTVLSKRRNWIEVEYQYENGEVMRGWVFTRYTKKFVK